MINTLNHISRHQSKQSALRLSVRGKISRNNSVSASVDPKKAQVELKHIPSLPLIGSTFPSYSGVNFDPKDTFAIWSDAREKFGDFYTLGVPGQGTGIHSTVHILQDPQEMSKVLRSEGKYPSSAVENLWTFQKMSKDYGLGRSSQILGHGEDWKLIRNFLQADFLAPKSANRYLPGILKTTSFISKGMPQYSDDLNRFLQFASFDMFCSILLGTFPRITDPDADSNPEDIEFCENVAKSLSEGSKMVQDPYEAILNKLGIKSAMYKDVYKSYASALDYGMKKILELEEKSKAGTLSEIEEASYWRQAMNRLEKSETDLTKEEVNQICLSLFTASVDTTSAKTAWHLLHIALNEEAQEKLFQEIHSNVQETDGKITPSLFAGSNSTYLGAVLRESNRLTCPTNLAPMRRIDKDLEIHGHMIPAGSTVGFDQMSKSLDPEFVDDPFTFRPERFLPDAIEKRKGTKSEFLDHPLFSGPFGQGARRCPGSRVARNESMALLAQCVLDWKMSIPGVSDYRDVPYGLETLVVPTLPTFNFESRK